MPLICGCGLSFKASGLQNHQCQSQDSCCKDCKDDRDFDSNNLDLNPHDIINNILEKIPGATVKRCAKVWAQETEWSVEIYKISITHNLKDNNFNTYLYLQGGSS